jgi:hypothetical protein
MNYTDTNEQAFLPGHTAQQPDEVDVILIQLPKNEKEKIPNVKASFRQNGDLDLTKLVQNLKQMDYPLDMNMIFYYSPNTDMYIYCGKEPLHHNTFVPSQELAVNDDRKELCLRIRHIEHTITQSIDPSLELETAALIDVDPELDQDSSSTNNEKGKRKRHKERKIGEVLDLVLKWRKLYSGIRDPRTGQIVKLSLDDAAKRVGVAKKSLDDYLLQIRSAKKSGFNFQEHYNERVGVLRSYVKKTKTTKSSSTRHHDTDQEYEELSEQMPAKSLRSKKIRKGYDDVYGNE